jgi:hypothetical protein
MRHDTAVFMKKKLHFAAHHMMEKDIYLQASMNKGKARKFLQF